MSKKMDSPVRVVRHGIMSKKMDPSGRDQIQVDAV